MGSSSRMVVEEAENWGAGEGGAHNDGGAKWATLLPDSHPSQDRGPCCAPGPARRDASFKAQQPARSTHPIYAGRGQGSETRRSQGGEGRAEPPAHRPPRQAPAPGSPSWPPARLLALLTSCCCFSSSRLTVLQPMFSSPSDSEPPLAERSSSRSKSWRRGDQAQSRPQPARPP